MLAVKARLMNEQQQQQGRHDTHRRLLVVMERPQIFALPNICFCLRVSLCVFPGFIFP